MINLLKRFILTASARDRGFAIRYGGDEFLIVLVNVGKEEALATARLTLDGLVSKMDMSMR